MATYPQTDVAVPEQTAVVVYADAACTLLAPVYDTSGNVLAGSQVQTPEGLIPADAVLIPDTLNLNLQAVYVKLSTGRTVELRQSATAVTNKGTTAQRPNAVASGQGARFYDTTLSKPIFSDGAVWRDAMANAV